MPPLRELILRALKGRRGVTSAALSAELNAPITDVIIELSVLVDDGLVDAHTPADRGEMPTYHLTEEVTV